MAVAPLYIGGNRVPIVFSTTVSSWSASGDKYYNNVSHNLGTKDILVMARQTSDDVFKEVWDYTASDTNTVKVEVDSDSYTLQIIVIG